MKKTYINPTLTIHRVQVKNMMAVSLQGGPADGSDALTKENFWGDDDWDE